MATLVLATAGQVLGGPLGGAIGGWIGNRIDRTILAENRRTGPRLRELQVTTASYGTPIPRHFGKVRYPGTIIWSTDLLESKTKSGGGKGKPSLTTYSYSVSFAIAVASRPIAGIGRIWADGSLLRGSDGKLKVGGQLRIYCGHGDQAPDPLLQAACGPGCPAFRGLAYCVFEDLQLGEFGNRIPALTFEIIADETPVALADMLQKVGQTVQVDRPLDNLAGFTDEGGALVSALQTIDQVYPLFCDASGQALVIKGAETIPSDPPLLPQAAVDPSGESFGNVSGIRKRRHADLREIPEGLRYYDLGRDYQAGLQRSDSRARSGRSTVIEFPGVLEAADARALANRAAERASWNHDCLSWRIAELDPQLTPGQIVRVPGKRGLWRIISWEWRNTGVELELLRLPHVADRMQAADTGTAVLQPDLPLSPTVLHAFELPWDGTGSSSERVVFAAASSASPGWPGAALFVDANGALEPLGPSGRQRCIVGHLVAPLAPADPALIDRSSNLLVDLIAPDLGLAEVSISALAAGANRALVGREVIQFANAEHLGGSRWRLSALLRGRGGTERHASIPHPEGEPFILIDDKPMRLDPAGIGNATAIAASSLADSEPVATAIAMAGQTLTPLIPVHPKAQRLPDGSLALGWTRRARGAWAWNDLVEAPLVEEAERYRVGLGNPSSPELVWEVTSTSLTLQATTVNGLAATHPGKPIWVRQIGNHAESDPLLLFTLP